MSQRIAILAQKLAKPHTREKLLKLIPAKTYEDGRTQQTFKNETDINKIMQRFQKTGTVSHLNKHQGRYGDFADFDFFENQIKLTQGRAMFDELPSELRKEFNHSPQVFFDTINGVQGETAQAQLLKRLAEPGRQFVDVSGTTPPDGAAVAREAQPNENQNPSPPPEASPSQPPETP